MYSKTPEESILQNFIFVHAIQFLKANLLVTPYVCKTILRSLGAFAIFFVFLDSDWI